jgi:hypothetical protein
VPHQLLGVIAAVNRHSHTAGAGRTRRSDACSRPIRDRDGAVCADEQVVGADIGV